jgi:hypothetical protein
MGVIRCNSTRAVPAVPCFRPSWPATAGQYRTRVSISVRAAPLPPPPALLLVLLHLVAAMRPAITRQNNTTAQGWAGEGSHGCWGWSSLALPACASSHRPPPDPAPDPASAQSRAPRAVTRSRACCFRSCSRSTPASCSSAPQIWKQTGRLLPLDLPSPPRCRLHYRPTRPRPASGQRRHHRRTSR